MHAGLVPVVTREASVDLDGFGLEIPEATVESVRDSVAAMSAKPVDDLRGESFAAREHVRAHHTRRTFARDHRRVIAEVLGLEGGGASRSVGA